MMLGFSRSRRFVAGLLVVAVLTILHSGQPLAVAAQYLRQSLITGLQAVESIRRETRPRLESRMGNSGNRDKKSYNANSQLTGNLPAGSGGINATYASDLPKTASDPAVSGGMSAQSDQTVTYDLVIKGGRVIDPESGLDQSGLNLGIMGGTVTALTSAPLKGRIEIDAGGLIVAPGFIDLLSYNPNDVGVWNKLADGVTTNIGTHGTTIAPRGWFSTYGARRLPLHYGGSFSYPQARVKLEINQYRPASELQIKEIYGMAESALLNGCLGISISLEYMPGVSSAECLSMMRLARKYGVPVFYHARYSDMEPPGTNLDALQEVIGYARETGAAVHIDHINSTGGTFSMKQSLALLEEARASGVDVTACTYPYNFWATYLNSARFDRGWQSRFRIDYKDLQIGGSEETLTEASYRKYRKQGKLAAAFAIPEEDVRDALRCPWVIVASDGILEPGYNNHPRASGMCARLIGHYVRDEKVLTLMEAIAKLTILPARRLQGTAPALRKKGRLSPGADADIVVFDFQKISDRATVAHPEAMSVGIEYVLVGGQIVKDPKGLNKQVRNGKPIKSEVHAVSPDRRPPGRPSLVTANRPLP
jgi:N-acyl-D-aspartate/D-glutamate deacylase